MKKIINFISLFLCTIAISCNNSNVEPFTIGESFIVKYEGMEAVIPNSFPKNILQFSESDINGANARLTSNSKKYDITKLANLYNRLLKKYPDLANLDDKEFAKLKKWFPNVTANDLKDIEKFWAFYEKLLAYEMNENIAETEIDLSKMRPNGLYDSYQSFKQLNSQEQTFLIFHGRMVNGVNFAKNNAQDLANTKIPIASVPAGQNPGYQTRNDALRHSILTALIAKHGGKDYGSVNKAADLAIEFTDKHEDGDTSAAPEIDHAMDKHNNRVGAEYFRSVGFTVNGNCFLGICGKDVSGPADNTMVDALFNKGFVKRTTITTINSQAKTSHVFLREYTEPVITN